MPITLIQLKSYPNYQLETKLVFGMYADRGIQNVLHNQRNVHSENVKIFYYYLSSYKTLYLEKYRRNCECFNFLDVLTFQEMGLRLNNGSMDVETRNFNSIVSYSNRVFQNTITCLEIEVEEIVEQDINFDPLI